MAAFQSGDSRTKNSSVHSENNLMNRNRGQEDILCLGAEILAKYVFRHGDR
jgi:hypothetical protein